MIRLSTSDFAVGDVVKIHALPYFGRFATIKRLSKGVAVVQLHINEQSIRIDPDLMRLADSYVK